MNHASQHQLELLQDRFGMRLAARLSGSAEQLPYEITERLRAARTQALSSRKREKLAPARSLVQAGGGTLALTPGDEGLDWPIRLASLLPLVALVAGLLGLQVGLDEVVADELAEVDAALLIDDLPPSAYTDPGFAQYLKSSGNRP
jgi:hypothetical protein